MNYVMIKFGSRVFSVLVLCIAIGGHAFADGAPQVIGPITGGKGAPVLFGHTAFDLESVGYVQSEYFIEGTASAYLPQKPLTEDGKWEIKPVSQASYLTRVVVNRPLDGEHFNGTVVVEWLNVTGTVDASPDWMHLHNELIRRGYAWVGVSAQETGLIANRDRVDAERYAAVEHPGDSYSYDIYSQVGKAIRDHAGTILGGLQPDQLISVGESQSASRLTTYINGFHPTARVYDGFLVHSRIRSEGAALSQELLAQVETPAVTLIRDDLDTPVLVFNAENDVGGVVARQPDTDWFQLWEVAGTAHYDLYGLAIGEEDIGDIAAVNRWLQALLAPPAQPSPHHTCEEAVNNGAQTFVLRAALAHMNRWIAEGKALPVAPRFETASLDPVTYELDEYGNILGGIRTPPVDAPVAVLTGLGNDGSFACRLFGVTMPLTDEQLERKYGNHDNFVKAWTAATDAALEAGFLVAEDAELIRQAGEQSKILK